MELIKRTENIKFSKSCLQALQEVELTANRVISCCLFSSGQKLLFGQNTHYAVDVGKLKSFTGETGKSFWEKIEITLKVLKETTFVLQTSDGDLFTSLVFEYHVERRTDTITICWNPNFIPCISGMMPPGGFVTIQLQMLGINSSKRYNLYLELAKHLWKLKTYGKFTLSYEEVRTALGVHSVEYPQFGEITRKFIKPLLKDLENILAIHLTVKASSGRVVFSQIKRSFDGCQHFEV